MRTILFVLILFLSFLLLNTDLWAQTTSPWLQQNRDRISNLENKLTFPQQINITVRQGQVVSVTGGARRFARKADNIDQILVTKYQGNFECLDKTGTNRPGNYVDTHELKFFWFLDDSNMRGARDYNGYAAIEGAFDDRDRVLYNTRELVQMCEGALFPEGQVTTFPIERNVELGAVCVGEDKGSSFWADFDYVIYEVVNQDTFTVNLTCDNTLAKAHRDSRRTEDGRFLHRCPEGMHINGTHEDFAYTRRPVTKYCRNSEIATKLKREFDEPGTTTTYEVWCPDGHFVKNSDLQYTLSITPFPESDFICYPYQYSWTQRKG